MTEHAKSVHVVKQRRARGKSTDKTNETGLSGRKRVDTNGCYVACAVQLFLSKDSDHGLMSKGFSRQNVD